MKVVFKRELSALLCGLRGWGYAVVVLLCTAVLVIRNNLMTGSAHFEVNAPYIALAMIAATALTAADAFHADRRQNTERLLYSLPLKNTDIVLGKLLAHFVPVMIAGIGLCAYPAMMLLLGEVPLETAYTSILMLTTLGIAMMSIALFISACTPNVWMGMLCTLAVLALSWLAPLGAQYIRGIFTFNIGLVIAVMIIVFVVSYWVSGSSMAAIVMTALVEIPLLLHYWRGTGSELMHAAAQGIASLSLFDGLSACVNGILDGRVLAGYLAAAAFAAVCTVMYIGNRRQAKRRAL